MRRQAIVWRSIRPIFGLAMSVSVLSAQQSPRPLRLVPEIRIDGESANLVPVEALSANRQGTIMLLQSQDQSVRFFDVKGKAAGSFGRRGEGPGEFKVPIEAGWIADTGWVWDGVLRRMTFFTANGRLVRLTSGITFQHANGAGHATAVRVVGVARGGDLLATALHTSGDGRGSNAIFEKVIVRTSPSGVIQQVVVMRPHDDGLLRIEAGSLVWEGSLPFVAHPLLGVAPDGARIGALTAGSGPAHGTMLMTVMTSSGVAVFSRSFPVHEEPIPRRVADSAIAAMAGRIQSMPLKKVFEPEARRRELIFAPFTAMFLANDGRVWIGLRATSTEQPWMILDGNGNHVGSLVAPIGVSLRAADATKVWGLERHDDESESVVRYRIEAAGAGGR